MMESNREVKISVYPLYYGDNNVTEAFEKKEMGFELSVKTDKYIQKNILTLEEVERLKLQIISSLEAYQEFMDS